MAKVLFKAGKSNLAVPSSLCSPCGCPEGWEGWPVATPNADAFSTRSNRDNLTESPTFLTCLNHCHWHFQLPFLDFTHRYQLET